MASAQYRPPPPTEAEQLTREADGVRADAARKDASGDRKGAAQLYLRAIETYERALTADPESVAAATGLGAACVARRDYARAVKDLTPFHARHPDAADVSFDLGLSLFKLHKISDALPLLEPLAKADAPEHFMAHYYLGTYALTQHDGERAVEELQAFLKRRPAELAVGDAQVEELIGRGFLLQRKPEEAKAAFARSQKERPSSAAQLGMAAAMEMEGQAQPALQLVESLAVKDPRNAEVMDRLARMYLQRGNLQRASEVADKLVKTQRSAISLALYGDVRAAQKDWKSAAEQYREAVKLQPGWPQALLGLAHALEQQGMHEQAIGELLRGGSDPRILAALGSAYRRAGHFQKALETHDKLPKGAEKLVLVGADHFAVGQWDDAVSDYSGALELDAKNARARHCLMLALWRRAQVRATTRLADQALFDLKRAYDLEPSEPLAQSLAALELQQQKYADAEATLASQKNPSLFSRILLGWALLGTGKAKEAFAVFDKLATPDPALSSSLDLGWALAKLSLDDYDAAVKRLQSAKAPSPALREDLRLAVTRLAWKKLEDGDYAAAAHAFSALPAGDAAPQVAHAAALAHALIAIDDKEYAEALSLIRGALAQREPWVEPAARPLLEAYVHYRMGRLPEARKELVAAQKLGKPPFAARLLRAIDEREAEQLYATTSNALGRIQRLLKGDESDPRTQHNLACARYKAGQKAAAVAAWKSLSSKLPEAELNLGLHALQQEKDPRGALEHFKRYTQAAGARSGAAREWVDRLQQLYGDQ